MPSRASPANTSHALTTTPFLLLCIATGVRLAFFLFSVLPIYGKQSLLRLPEPRFRALYPFSCSLFPLTLFDEMTLAGLDDTHNTMDGMGMDGRDLVQLSGQRYGR
jgi:hypothetical protein